MEERARLSVSVTVIKAAKHFVENMQYTNIEFEIFQTSKVDLSLPQFTKQNF